MDSGQFRTSRIRFRACGDAVSTAKLFISERKCTDQKGTSGQKYLSCFISFTCANMIYFFLLIVVWFIVQSRAQSTYSVPVRKWSCVSAESWTHLDVGIVLTISFLPLIWDWFSFVFPVPGSPCGNDSVLWICTNVSTMSWKVLISCIKHLDEITFQFYCHEHFYWCVCCDCSNLKFRLLVTSKFNHISL